MALSDYRLCDNCGGKAFYDPYGEIDTSVALCAGCSTAYEAVIVRKGTNIADEARAQERARIRAIVSALRDDLVHVYEQPYDQRPFDLTKEEIETLEEVLNLIDQRVLALIDTEDTSHE